VWTCYAGDHEYIDVLVENNSGKSERLIIDIDFRSHFEIARAVDSYNRILNSIPVVYVGSPTRLKQFLGIMVEATRTSLQQNSMPLPPWRSLAYLQAKWLSPYERITHSDNNINFGNDDKCFDHKQCHGHLKKLQSCLQTGMEVERMLKARNMESNRRIKPDRWRHSLLRPIWHVQILALKFQSSEWINIKYKILRLFSPRRKLLILIRSLSSRIRQFWLYISSLFLIDIWGVTLAES